MKKVWEYELIQIQAGQGLKAVLKTAGEDGWEAWFFDPVKMVVFVKREQQKIVIAAAIPSP